MRPLHQQDYLLIAIIVLTALVGSVALVVGILKVREEMRERRTLREGSRQKARVRVTAANLRGKST